MAANKKDGCKVNFCWKFLQTIFFNFFFEYKKKLHISTQPSFCFWAKNSNDGWIWELLDILYQLKTLTKDHIPPIVLKMAGDLTFLTFWEKNLANWAVLSHLLSTLHVKACLSFKIVKFWWFHVRFEPWNRHFMSRARKDGWESPKMSAKMLSSHSLN